MAGARHYSELDVYLLSQKLEQDVCEILKRPGVRMGSVLHDQLDRSSSGPCPNIAEGFSRYYPLDNARFVRIARSSLSETIVHLGKAARKEYISENEHEALVRLAKRAGGAATRYIQYLETATAPGTPQRRGSRKRKPGK
jgi:four helix bundle protein